MSQTFEYVVTCENDDGHIDHFKWSGTLEEADALRTKLKARWANYWYMESKEEWYVRLYPYKPRK
jgi:hypothetical protein